MVLVRRGNVELEVHEDFLQQYLSKGFDKIDEKGKVVEKGTANNFNSLKLAYVELNKENQSILLENQKLKNKVNELEAEVKKLQKKNSTKTNKE